MTTRLQRQQKSTSARLVKVQRLKDFHEFIAPLVFLAAGRLALNDFHDDYLLPKEMDVSMTSRQVRDRFGAQCRDIFEHLFIRWTPKWVDRQPIWKINPVAAVEYGLWLRDNKDATPAEALSAIRRHAEKLRRLRMYDENGPTRNFEVVSREEAQRLLDNGQRALRQTWALKIFREDLQKEEALR